MCFDNVCYGLATVPASQNPNIKREINAVLERTQVRYAESEDATNLLKANNASCLLLSSGKYLVTKEVAKDDLKLLRATIHEDIEAIMQILQRNKPYKYRGIKDLILKYFPPEAENTLPIELYVNHTVARIFEWLVLIEQGILFEDQIPEDSVIFVKKAEPIINAYRHSYFTSEFWDPVLRGEMIRLALRDGMRFYQVANDEPIDDAKGGTPIVPMREGIERLKEFIAVKLAQDPDKPVVIMVDGVAGAGKTQFLRQILPRGGQVRLINRDDYTYSYRDNDSYDEVTDIDYAQIAMDIKEQTERKDVKLVIFEGYRAYYLPLDVDFKVNLTADEGARASNIGQDKYPRVGRLRDNETLEAGEYDLIMDNSEPFRLTISEKIDLLDRVSPAAPDPGWVDVLYGGLSCYPKYANLMEIFEQWQEYYEGRTYEKLFLALTMALSPGLDISDEIRKDSVENIIYEVHGISSDMLRWEMLFLLADRMSGVELFTARADELFDEVFLLLADRAEKSGDNDCRILSSLLNRAKNKHTADRVSAAIKEYGLKGIKPSRLISERDDLDRSGLETIDDILSLYPHSDQVWRVVKLAKKMMRFDDMENEIGQLLDWLIVKGEDTLSGNFLADITEYDNLLPKVELLFDRLLVRAKKEDEKSRANSHFNVRSVLRDMGQCPALSVKVTAEIDKLGLEEPQRTLLELYAMSGRKHLNKVFVENMLIMVNKVKGARLNNGPCADDVFREVTENLVEQKYLQEALVVAKAIEDAQCRAFCMEKIAVEMSMSTDLLPLAVSVFREAVRAFTTEKRNEYLSLHRAVFLAAQDESGCLMQDVVKYINSLGDRVSYRYDNILSLRDQIVEYLENELRTNPGYSQAVTGKLVEHSEKLLGAQSLAAVDAPGRINDVTANPESSGDVVRVGDAEMHISDAAEPVTMEDAPKQVVVNKDFDDIPHEAKLFLLETMIFESCVEDGESIAMNWSRGLDASRKNKFKQNPYQNTDFKKVAFFSMDVGSFARESADIALEAAGGDLIAAFDMVYKRMKTHERAEEFEDEEIAFVSYQLCIDNRAILRELGCKFRFWLQDDDPWEWPVKTYNICVQPDMSKYSEKIKPLIADERVPKTERVGDAYELKFDTARAPSKYLLEVLNADPAKADECKSFGKLRLFTFREQAVKLLCYDGYPLMAWLNRGGKVEEIDILEIWRDPGLYNSLVAERMLGRCIFGLINDGKKKVIRSHEDGNIPYWDSVLPAYHEFTELMLSVVHRRLRINEGTKVLDLGCGSGVIAVDLASKIREDFSVDAVDINPYAVACARGYVANVGLSDRINVWQSDLLSRVHDKYDIIIFNAPHFRTIPRNVGDGALSSDDVGGKLVESLFASLKSRLREGGFLYIMNSKYAPIVELAQKYGLEAEEDFKSSEKDAVVYKIRAGKVMSQDSCPGGMNLVQMAKCDTNGATFLLTDLIYAQLQEDRTHEIRYDTSRLSPSQVRLIEIYVNMLKARSVDPDNIKAKPFSSSAGSKESLIAVYCTGAGFKGEGHVDVSVSGNDLKQYLLRVVGMINIALASSNIPDKLADGDVYKYQQLMNYIKIQYEKTFYLNLEIPNSTFAILQVLKNIIIDLPKSMRMDAEKVVDEYNRMVGEMLIRA